MTRAEDLKKIYDPERVIFNSKLIGIRGRSYPNGSIEIGTHFGEELSIEEKVMTVLHELVHIDKMRKGIYANSDKKWDARKGAFDVEVFDKPHTLVRGTLRASKSPEQTSAHQESSILDCHQGLTSLRFKPRYTQGLFDYKDEEDVEAEAQKIYKKNLEFVCYIEHTLELRKHDFVQRNIDDANGQLRLFE